MDRFSGKACDTIASEAIEALKTVAEKHGLNVVPARGNYGDTEFTFKASFVIPTKVGGITINTPQAKHYVNMCKWNSDFKAEWLGKTFMFKGMQYRLDGYKPRSPKRPFICTRLNNNKSYIHQEGSIKAGFKDK